MRCLCARPDPEPAGQVAKHRRKLPKCGIRFWPDHRQETPVARGCERESIRPEVRLLFGLRVRAHSDWQRRWFHTVVPGRRRHEPPWNPILATRPSPAAFPPVSRSERHGPAASRPLFSSLGAPGRGLPRRVTRAPGATRRPTGQAPCPAGSPISEAGPGAQWHPGSARRTRSSRTGPWPRLRKRRQTFRPPIPFSAWHWRVLKRAPSAHGSGGPPPSFQGRKRYPAGAED